ncbi:MAG: beta-ketoacyl-[acyl-carrier-protein] synthase family protein, partial [Thiomonas delicata]
MNQVFMTGIGMLSPLGKDRQASFAAALSAHSAIRRAPEALSAGLPNVLMAPAAVEPESLLDSQDAGLDRATQFSLV